MLFATLPATPAAISSAHSCSSQVSNGTLSKNRLNRFGEVEEIAALVAWLASEDCSFSTAAVFDISGGRGTY